MTLVEFLRARLDDDEAVVAEWPDRGTWGLHSPGLMWVDPHGQPIYAPRARVLADVKAKRAIVELRAALSQMDRTDDRWEAGQIQSADFAVRHLATAYADHPDYRQEWKPWP